MKIKTATFNSEGKTYTYKYLQYTQLATMYKQQKMIMGVCFYKRFRMERKKGNIRFRKIMAAIMNKITEEITLGATVDFGMYEISMDKRLTKRKTSTTFNGYLYVPVIKYKNLPRLKNSLHDIRPSIEMQIRIRKGFQNNLYENL